MGTKYKTKFPMARIKKIMQIDKEIGKVAQATPIVISKALELFLQRLIDCAVAELPPAITNPASNNNPTLFANTAGSAGGTTLPNIRLSPAAIKRAVLKTEELDFLKELVSKLPDQEDHPSPPSLLSTPSKKRTRQVGPSEHAPFSSKHSTRPSNSPENAPNSDMEGEDDDDGDADRDGDGDDDDGDDDKNDETPFRQKRPPRRTAAARMKIMALLSTDTSE